MVFLVGYMYSGKSTTARLLADYLKEHYDSRVEWIDTDEAVEERYHLTIADCFRRYGEPLFRSLESTVLHSLTVSGQQSPVTNTLTQSHNNTVNLHLISSQEPGLFAAAMGAGASVGYGGVFAFAIIAPCDSGDGVHLHLAAF